ncbi:histidine kinase [Ichthyenterobacterium magnum]|uniref:Tetratricopeptide repeat protein n=1 Tax=Ichthyenterobacterium magnum TaxID=1230530 RepID=A0A420DFJ3_9FLAO|nr:histidine kinase [Ichthyenterobacterium magnum]RKE91876.1 tetratricopeptide repeat protein [Ichthyenterobacterium magnum]
MYVYSLEVDMRFIIKYIIIFFVSLSFQQATSQAQNKKVENLTFTIRGLVRESDTYEPISKVNIEVNGGAYTMTDDDGTFRIKAKKGDELIVRHKDFETVYYTIKDDNRVTIEVEPNIPSSNQRLYKSRSDSKTFNSLVDSAATYLKKDAEKSIQFVADALPLSGSVKQNAEAYEVLADVYFQWKQYDLAVTNYRISLQNYETNEVKLKLAKAYQSNKNYQESIETYNAIKKKDLSNYQLTTLYEGLGDTYSSIKDFKASINSYLMGLDIAQKHLITPKITDLNSKIAQAYNAAGQTTKAEGFFSNSLSLAEQENKTRAVKEKVTVAEFNNLNQNYEEEIKLRKESLDDIKDIETDSVIDNASAITPQKQNYKIGTAYFLQKDFDSAIPYLEKSIEEADLKEDLIVKKDATRKLSDVYVDAGDYKKALSTYKEYTATVDELYIKREQELSQADRFRRNLNEKQNRITSLESDRELSESKYQLTSERNKSQQLIIYSLIGGVILLLVTAYFMFKYIKQQKFANNLLALKSLRSQMNPHFIFNALNSVNSFIASNDERTANKYLSDFSYLMRAVLENSEEDFIPLQKEIDLLELYTKLEHFRFKDKFEYSIVVEDAINVNEFQIPPMLLQPYIENAVWHGLRYKTVKGHLNIAIAQKSKTELTITITDDGIGRKRSKALKTENQQKQNSKGMGNIKKRVAILNEMYKDKVDVFIDDFHDAEDTGTKVVVTLKKD